MTSIFTTLGSTFWATDSTDPSAAGAGDCEATWEVDTGLAIMITPEHCEAYPIRCDEAVHESFLFTVEVARWILQTSKDAMGPPLVKECA